MKRLRSQVGDKNPFYGKHHTEETCVRMSETRTRLIAEGKISSGPRGWKGTYVSVKTEREESYDSFYELIQMRMYDVDDLVTFWTKKHKIRINYVWNDRTRIYVPDFLVQFGNQITIEEIKGFEDASKLEAKLNALIEFCAARGYSCSYLDHSKLEQRVRSKYGEGISSLRKKENRT